VIHAELTKQNSGSVLNLFGVTGWDVISDLAGASQWKPPD
jgi:hypothetical protein